MELHNLGKVAWYESQLFYHAFARVGKEALILLSPSTPYVCIGFHQDAEQEVDLEHCSANGIPLFRREVGGGAVYLDGNQLFFQLVLLRDNPIIPKNKAMFYRKFLSPIINVYRATGIPAEYKPLNDIMVHSRKISGTGVGEIGECVVFVGNIIIDFDYEMMCRVLRVPDEKFRDKVYRSLMENLTTMKRELGEERAAQWTEAKLNHMMAAEFQKITGPLDSESDIMSSPSFQSVLEELREVMLSEKWLHHTGKSIAERKVKIRTGANVFQKMHKAPGGLIRADFEIRDNRYINISFSGDFFCFPSDAIRGLERKLEGGNVAETKNILLTFYSQKEVEIPGIEVDDWMQLLETQKRF
jgi:lipoate-protein ligase A